RGDATMGRQVDNLPTHCCIASCLLPVRSQPMDIIRIRALRGPNVWASFAVLEAWVHAGRFSGATFQSIPGFMTRLAAWIPALGEQLRPDTSLAHALVRLTLELQSLAGTRVQFGQALVTPADQAVYQLSIEYQQEELARECLSVSREVCLAAIEDRPF